LRNKKRETQTSLQKQKQTMIDFFNGILLFYDRHQLSVNQEFYKATASLKMNEELKDSMIPKFTSAF